MMNYNGQRGRQQKKKKKKIKIWKKKQRKEQERGTGARIGPLNCRVPASVCNVINMDLYCSTESILN